MSLEEISDIIDTNLSSYEMGIKLDEYEKSLYLTRAQNMIYNELLQLFEKDGLISKDLEPFIQESVITTPLARTGSIANSIFFQLPTDLRKIVYEAATLSSSDPLLSNRVVKSIKTKLAEVSRKMNSPFRESNYEEILRVVTEDESSVSVAELIPPTGCTFTNYRIKYIQKVTPIVLEDLPDGLEIESVSSATNSKFNTEKLTQIIDLCIQLILKDKSIYAKS